MGIRHRHTGHTCGPRLATLLNLVLRYMGYPGLTNDNETNRPAGLSNTAFLSALQKVCNISTDSVLLTA